MALLLTAGCSVPTEVHVTDTASESWSEAAELEWTNTDTLALRDLALVLRTDDRFGEDTLTLYLGFTPPDSLRRYTERVVFRIPRYRTATAVRSENILPYRTAVRLADSGRYRLCIAPARTVRGVEAVGIRFAPHDPQQPTETSAPTWEKTNCADSPRI